MNLSAPCSAATINYCLLICKDCLEVSESNGCRFVQETSSPKQNRFCCLKDTSV